MVKGNESVELPFRGRRGSWHRRQRDDEGIGRLQAVDQPDVGRDQLSFLVTGLTDQVDSPLDDTVLLPNPPLDLLGPLVDAL